MDVTVYISPKLYVLKLLADILIIVVLLYGLLSIIRYTGVYSITIISWINWIGTHNLCFNLGHYVLMPSSSVRCKHKIYITYIHITN